jgi:hypothetical protein
MKETLDVLDAAAQTLLKQAKTLGRVFIITNAADGWVQMSSERFLPLVCQEIKNDITIISARHKFEK